MRRRQHAFTITELLVVLVVAGVLLTLAAPALRNFIKLQRLKSANALLVTDMQFARSEAVARNQYMRVAFANSSSLTCYTLYTITPTAPRSTRCDCRLGVGSACPNPALATEVRTVQHLFSDSVYVIPRPGVFQDSAFAFDHVSGGIVSIPSDADGTPLGLYTIAAFVDAVSNPLQMYTRISAAGRPSVCAPSSGAVGAPAC